MATAKPKKPEASAEPPEDFEAQAPASAASPTQGEVDELREENLNLQAEKAQLQSQIEQMNQRMARLERLALGGQAYEQPTEGVDREPTGAVPVFDEEQPCGTIWGDSEAAYMQNGHYFGPDKLYVRSDPVERRGSPRAFKPQLVGLVVRVTPKAA